MKVSPMRSSLRAMTRNIVKSNFPKKNIKSIIKFIILN